VSDSGWVLDSVKVTVKATESGSDYGSGWGSVTDCETDSVMASETDLHLATASEKDSQLA
jgi:hypothetical protein